MGNSDEKLKPFDFALKLEETGRNFYLDEAAKMRSEAAKKVFLSIADEELKHIERINRIFASVNKGKNIEESGWESIKIDAANLGSVFRAVSKTKQGIKAAKDERAVIKTAMDNETRGYRFYEKTARETNDMPVRIFFETLMKEEGAHFKVLQDTYEYLFDTASWYIKSEGRVIEG